MQLMCLASAAAHLHYLMCRSCINLRADICIRCHLTQYAPAAASSATLDYCPATKTLSGCKCHPNWSLDNKTYYGTCANDGDKRGSWCVVDRATCPGAHRAHQYGANNTITTMVDGRDANLTGLDFDYCQVTTVNGCHCRNSWSYGGVTYSGTCRQGLQAGKGLPGYSVDTPWCYVDSGCTGAGYLEGQRFDICTQEGGRVTESGAACDLPASYNGVAMYDCLSYNQSSNTNASQPWCFTNATSGDWGYCAPWSCSAAMKQHCPSADPSAGGANLSAWSDAGCLESLCNARQALANISQCTQDGVEGRTLLNSTYRFLASSSQFGSVLKSSTGYGAWLSPWQPQCCMLLAWVLRCKIWHDVCQC